MSNANARVTRSASKARSTGAGSTGAASVGGSSRGRSRRGGSAAPLAEDDKPAVGNQVTRAYGTEGRSAQAQLLSAQIGMHQAVNPIANAVARAQAPETPVANASDRLPALPEEAEASEGSDRSFVPHRPHVGQRRPSVDSTEFGPPVQESFLTRWGPRRWGFNPEGPNRTSNNVIENNTRGYDYDYPPEPITYHFINPWTPAVFARDAVLVLLGLLILLWLYEVNRTRLFGFGDESGISKGFSIAPEKWGILDHRVSKVEQHVQDLSLESTSVDAAATKHQINWFTPGFGTGIDLYLSSPTISDCDPAWTPYGWPWSLFKSQSCPQVSLSAPQFAALSPWTDPVDDSWCAPPSNGKLQLAVVLSRTVVPTELVVEHGAKDEMPVGFMGSSPREVELWIQIPNDRTRAAVRHAITIMDPSLLEDSSPQGKTIGAQALPFDYVPVGRWEYNIHTNQRLQTFPVQLSLGEYGASATNVAVRVNSNWGNVRFTCLSRLRLYGDDVSGIMEELDPSPA